MTYDEIYKWCRALVDTLTSDQADAVAMKFATQQGDAPPTAVAPGDEQIIRSAVAAMNAPPGVADDLLEGFTMHTEAEDIVAIWKAAALTSAPAVAPKFSCHLQRDNGKAPCDSDCGKLRCMYPSAPAEQFREVQPDGTTLDVDPAETTPAAGAIDAREQEVDLIARGMCWADTMTHMKEACAQAGVPWNEDTQPKSLVINVMQRVANAAHKTGFLLGLERAALASRSEAPAAAGATQAVAFGFVRQSDIENFPGANMLLAKRADEDWQTPVYLAAPASTPEASAAPAQAVEVSEVLHGVDAMLREAYAHWDAGRDYKVGKILLALIGHNKGYDKRSDAWCAALQASKPKLPSDFINAAGITAADSVATAIQKLDVAVLQNQKSDPLPR